jgi:hypothetical protein
MTTESTAHAADIEAIEQVVATDKVLPAADLALVARVT